MQRRDQNILARELRQQLIPRRRSRSLVDIKNRGDLGMLQLDSLCMDDVAPKQNFLSLLQKFGSAQEFVETRISGCFLKNDEFCFCDRHTLCLEQ